jgi:hypothetical protein
MGSLLIAAYALMTLFGIVSLVCFILVLVEMFRRQQTGLAIAFIVLAFCTGIGFPIAFVYGWTKAGEWNLKKVMVGWTVCWVVQLVIGLGVFAKVWANMEEATRHLQESQHQQEMQKMAEEMEKMTEDGKLDIKIE